MYVTLTCRKLEDGTWSVDDPSSNHGYLLPESLIDAIIKSCRKDKRSLRGKDRDAINESWAIENEKTYLYEQQQRRELAKAQKADPLLKPCKVYLMKDTVRGFVKIGITNNVSSRLIQLKTANPAIEIVAQYDGTLRDEKTLHGYFMKLGKRLDGEWFSLGTSDFEYIETYFSNQNAA